MGTHEPWPCYCYFQSNAVKQLKLAEESTMSGEPTRILELLADYQECL